MNVRNNRRGWRIWTLTGLAALGLVNAGCIHVDVKPPPKCHHTDDDRAARERDERRRPPADDDRVERQRRSEYRVEIDDD